MRRNGIFGIFDSVQRRWRRSFIVGSAARSTDIVVRSDIAVAFVSARKRGRHVRYSAAGRFNGSLALPATMVPGNTRLQLTSSLLPPAGAPVLGKGAQRRARDTGTFNVYFYTTIQVSSTITFPTLPTFSITLPTSLNPAGLQFFYAISNPAPTNGAKVQFGTQGPATVAGHIVTFASSSTPLTLHAGRSYTIAFYAITAIAPSPSPSPALNAKIFVANENTTVTSYTANGTPTTLTINTVFYPAALRSTRPERSTSWL